MEELMEVLASVKEGQARREAAKSERVRILDAINDSDLSESIKNVLRLMIGGGDDK